MDLVCSNPYHSRVDWTTFPSLSCKSSKGAKVSSDHVLKTTALEVLISDVSIIKREKSWGGEKRWGEQKTRKAFLLALN